eukprot:6068234-Pyramimonas_sp.AAC.1
MDAWPTSGSSCRDLIKHRGVLTQKLDAEGQALSRLGRDLIFQLRVARKWKVFPAGVKSAFLQSEDIDDR